MTKLENTATRDGEADRQMLVLALAHLAVERPGWLWTCRDMAVERFGAGPMFDDFVKLHQEALAAKKPSAADEEYVPHAFRPSLRIPSDGESIWCEDCDYHRDDPIHSSGERDDR